MRIRRACSSCDSTWRKSTRETERVALALGESRALVEQRIMQQRKTCW